MILSHSIHSPLLACIIDIQANGLTTTAYPHAHCLSSRWTVYTVLFATQDSGFGFIFQYGMTALSWAAWFGHKEAVMLLVNGGGNVTNTNRVSANTQTQNIQDITNMNLYKIAQICNTYTLLSYPEVCYRLTENSKMLRLISISPLSK